MYAISRRSFVSGAVALGAAVTTGTRGPARAGDRPPLPIPGELRADSKHSIALETRPGQRRFLDGKLTNTLGINADYLGPAIRVKRGERVYMHVRNAMDEDVSMHWHGLEIPGIADGSPYSVIHPGKTWTAALAIDQPAATLWMHPHVYPSTAEQVIKGLAGLFLIDDEESDALNLPSRWGIDDIPIILQDRRFDADGQFFHRFNLTAVTTGYVGNIMLVNGAHNPVAHTAKGWLRFRLLNGSNARSYRIVVSDGRPFYVVGSDGGLLSEPVELRELMLYTGERYELLIDARDGGPFDLATLPVRQLAMALPPFDGPLPLVTVRPDGADGTGTLPDALVTLPPLVSDLPPVSEKLVMGMRLDEEGMKPLMSAGLMKMEKSGKTNSDVVARVVKLITEGPALSLKEQLSANTVNDQSFTMGDIPIGVKIGEDVRWIVSEGRDRMLHPVHIHGCQFRILKLDGKTPPAHMAGWKDIAPVSQGGSCEIQVRFNHPATKDSPYMVHCHILEHEDSGMMTNFTVG